jgi:LexA-binding, inner membrane-associated putative hydrolase
MPTPLGHALGAAAAGWAVAPPLSTTGRSAVIETVRRGIWFGCLGMFPDLDLVVGVHRGPTHSVGAALIVALAAAALTGNVRLSAAAACAYVSHALLDWLGGDSSMPIGIMALWPMTWEYYQASTPIFESVWRRNETPDFWSHNFKAVARELVILVPLAWFGFEAARRRRGPAAPSAGGGTLKLSDDKDKQEGSRSGEN